MANANFAFGLKPVRRFSGAPYNCSARRYSCPATYATALFIGDPVVKTGNSDADGYSEVNSAASGGAITGVVVGFEDQPSLILGYGAASTVRAVLVADDPELLFEAQEDAVGGTIALATIGQNCDLISAAGSTTTRTSGWMIDSSTAATTSTLQVKLVEFAHRADNTAASANAKILVKINKHTELAGQAGL